MQSTHTTAEAMTAKDLRIKELNQVNPDWTCEERGDGKLLLGVKIIKHTDIISYLKFKKEGYRTIWVGEGKIALHKK